MPIGIFDDHGDIGPVLHAGSAAYDPGSGRYTLTGSGYNMWLRADEFQFLWTKLSGDFRLTADVAFPNPGVDAHRKACLIVRQSLDPGAPYYDIALHGDGLASLQFRDEQGAPTHEIQANAVAPGRLCLEKRGSYVRVYLGDTGGDVAFAGPATWIDFAEPFYVGLAVCSHNKDVVETAVFSSVELLSPLPAAEKPTLYSTLETIAVGSGDRRVCWVTPTHIEAPNWHPNGETLVYNGGGRLYRIPAAGGVPALIDTGFAIRCNNDHGISPDGSRIVISDQSQGSGQSLIYTLPFAGGTPELVTQNGPSYWHGWSPDGATLAYCAQRDGKFGIFTIPVGGGDETRLTTAVNLDDGPEYSPDGAWIYMNSDRTGRMQIWRVRPDGTDLEQVTDDEYNNWFAHPSPDGRFLSILSYGGDVAGHPPGKDVALRLMTLEDRSFQVVARLWGGQGTINVPCWSPDSRRFAFVSYQMI